MNKCNGENFLERTGILCFADGAIHTCYYEFDIAFLAAITWAFWIFLGAIILMLKGTTADKLIQILCLLFLAINLILGGVVYIIGQLGKDCARDRTVGFIGGLLALGEGYPVGSAIAKGTSRTHFYFRFTFFSLVTQTFLPDLVRFGVSVATLSKKNNVQKITKLTKTHKKKRLKISLDETNLLISQMGQSQNA